MLFRSNRRRGKGSKGNKGHSSGSGRSGGKSGSSKRGRGKKDDDYMNSPEDDDEEEKPKRGRNSKSSKSSGRKSKSADDEDEKEQLMEDCRNALDDYDKVQQRSMMVSVSVSNRYPKGKTKLEQFTLAELQELAEVLDIGGE